MHSIYKGLSLPVKLCLNPRWAITNKISTLWGLKLNLTKLVQCVYFHWKFHQPENLELIAKTTDRSREIFIFLESFKMGKYFIRFKTWVKDILRLEGLPIKVLKKINIFQVSMKWLIYIAEEMLMIPNIIATPQKSNLGTHGGFIRRLKVFMKIVP